MCVYNYHDCTIIREEPGPKLQRQTSVACRKFCSRFLLLVSQDSGTSWASGCSSLMADHLFLIQILRRKKKKSAEDFIYMPSFVVIQISRVGIRISFFPGRYLIISEQRIAGAENPTPTFTKMLTVFLPLQLPKVAQHMVRAGTSSHQISFLKWMLWGNVSEGGMWDFLEIGFEMAALI